MKIKGTRIRVVKGDITEQDVEAIVNAANNRLIMGGGVAGAIRKKGGPSIQKEATALGPIAIGEAVVTGGGRLKARYVIHAATMGMDFKTDETKIRAATRNSLKRAEEKKITSVAFPALGCGVGGFTPEKAARVMIEEVIRHLETPSALKEVVFVLFDANTFSAFERAISEHLEYTEGKTQCNPIPTVDVIIEMDDGIVLIRRKNPPYGWAIPGGFVDYGESLEEAVVREAKEETGLDLEGLRQFHTYSDPTRDPRGHTISTVFVARGRGIPKASDDAEELRIFNRENLPEELAFDHKKIIDDYFKAKLETGSNFLKR